MLIKAEVIDDNIQYIGKLLWADGPDIGRQLPLFCTSNILVRFLFTQGMDFNKSFKQPSIIRQLTPKAKLPVSDCIYEV
jgi:hypothetical protein